MVLGNLPSRTLTMIENYFGGIVPDAILPTARAFKGSLRHSVQLGDSAKRRYDKFDFSDVATRSLAVWFH